MKILIVDDDFATRKILMAALKSLGDCDLACNGLEAVHAFKEAYAENTVYDLVLLDILMPEMDGLAVLKNIRNHENKAGGRIGTKIVMATSVSDSNHVIGSFHEGCDGYILKPFTPQSVLRDLIKHGVLAQGVV